MNTNTRPGTVIALLALALGLPQTTYAYDWQGISNSYAQWTMSTLNTSLLNDAIEGQTGNRAPSVTPAWPVFNEAEIETRVFALEELNAMRQNDIRRAAVLLEGHRIIIEGVARRATRTLLWLDDPNNAVPYQGHVSWRTSTERPEFPADGTLVRIEGYVHDFGLSWVELRDPVIVSDAGILADNRSAPQHSGNGVDLTFTRSADVTQTVNTLITRQLAGALNAGVAEADLLNLLNGGALQGEFRRILALYDLSDSDLSDVMAAHLVMLWQVANNLPHHDEPRGLEIVRNELRAELMRAGWMAELDNAERQMFAEFLGTGTMLIVVRFLDATQRGDRAAISQSSADALAMVREVAGMDLQSVTLTAEGFIPR